MSVHITAFIYAQPFCSVQCLGIAVEKVCCDDYKKDCAC